MCVRWQPDGGTWGLEVSECSQRQAVGRGPRRISSSPTVLIMLISPTLRRRQRWQHPIRSSHHPILLSARHAGSLAPLVEIYLSHAGWIMDGCRYVLRGLAGFWLDSKCLAAYYSPISHVLSHDPRSSILDPRHLPPTTVSCPVDSIISQQRVHRSSVPSQLNSQSSAKGERSSSSSFFYPIVAQQRSPFCSTSIPVSPPAD